MPTGIMTPRVQAYQRLRKATHISSFARAQAPRLSEHSPVKLDAVSMLHESSVFRGRSGDRVVMSLMTHPGFRDGKGHLQATIVADPVEGQTRITGVDIFKSELHVNGRRIDAIFLPMIENVPTLITANVSGTDFDLGERQEILRIDLILATQNPELGRLHLMQMIAGRRRITS